MGDGLTPELAVAALAVGLVSLWVASRDLSFPIALALVTTKVGLTLAYFAWWFDGRWTFYDDITYWNQGKALLAAGFNPFTIFFQPEGLTTLFVMSLGPHILYGWWNHLAQFLFGPHYFAPVFLNVGLTFVAGAFFVRIARLAGFSERYAQGLLIFFLLHWDVVAWSSFTNLKDVLALTLSLAGLYFLVRIAVGPGGPWAKLPAVAGAIAVLLTLPWLRFYVPILLMGTFALWALLKTHGWRKYAVLAGAAAGILLALPRYVPTEYLQLSPGSAAYGLIRFALTPQPWSIQPEYSFLLLPSILHWALFTPSLMGAWLLWRRSSVGALLLLYLAVTTVLYAVVPELQGPRHRVQVIFAWIWMQYHFLYCLFAGLASARAYGGVEVTLPGRQWAEGTVG